MSSSEKIAVRAAEQQGLDVIYQVRLTETANEELSGLPARDATALLNFINTQLVRSPETIGVSLTGPLKGMFVIKHKGYSILYRVDNAAGALNVMTVT